MKCFGIVREENKQHPWEERKILPEGRGGTRAPRKVSKGSEEKREEDRAPHHKTQDLLKDVHLLHLTVSTLKLHTTPHLY